MSVILAKTIAATAFPSETQGDPVVRTDCAQARRSASRRSLTTLTGRASGFALFHNWNASKAA